MRGPKKQHKHTRILSSISGIQELVIPERRGVYFLTLGGEIVYVGKTINGIFRIGEHHKSKDFDGAFILPITKHNLISYERAFIKLFKPKLNDERDKVEIGMHDADLIGEVFSTIKSISLLTEYLKETQRDALDMIFRNPRFIV